MPAGDPKKPGLKAPKPAKQDCGEGLADMFREMESDAKLDEQARVRARAI